MIPYADFLRSRRYEHALNVTPSGSDVVVTSCDALIVGGTGVVKVDTQYETAVNITVTAGFVLPLKVTKVYNATTNATAIIALWSTPGGA